MELLFGPHPVIGTLAVAHAAILVVSLAALLLRSRAWRIAGELLLLGALLLNTWIVLDLWGEAGRPPFKTLFETMLLYPWCVALVTLVLVRLHGLFLLVPFAGAISAAGLGYALARPDLELVDLPPALQSGWFVPHVITYFIAYAALFASFALALVSLAAPVVRRLHFQKVRDPRSEPPFERHAHRAALFGLGTLTLGLVMGGVWAKYAWGDYWSWDPKENWALVSWLAYVLYLHLRLLDGWHGRRATWALVGAFGAVVFTYLGMHLLPTAEGSLHVYQ